MNSRSIILYSSHLFFTLLLLLGWHFGSERTNYADGAYYYFTLLWKESFCIEHGRWGAALFQLPAFLSVHFGFSPSMIAKIYSMSLAAIPWFTFSLIWHGLKNEKIAAWVPLFAVCGIATSFFSPVSELIPGLCWLLIALGLFYYPTLRFRFLFLVIACVIQVAAVSCHPLILPISGFIWIWIGLSSDSKWKTYFYLFISGTLYFVYTKLTGPSDTYEGDFFSYLLNPMGHFEVWKKLYPWTYFVKRSGTIYLSLLLLSGSTFVYLFLKKSYKALGLLITSTLLYGIFITIVFGAGDSDVMMERIFVPFAFMTAGCLFLTHKGNWENSWIYRSYPLFLFLSIPPILQASKFYTERLNYIESLNQKAKEQQKPWSWIRLSSLDQRLVEVPWGIGLETLVAGIKKNAPVTIYALKNEEDSSRIDGNRQQYFFTPFYFEIPRNQIPPKLIPLTHLPYQKLQL